MYYIPIYILHLSYVTVVIIVIYIIVIYRDSEMRFEFYVLSFLDCIPLLSLLLHYHEFFSS
jgi:hypothetical protein